MAVSRSKAVAISEQERLSFLRGIANGIFLSALVWAAIGYLILR